MAPIKPSALEVVLDTAYETLQVSSGKKVLAKIERARSEHDATRIAASLGLSLGRQWSALGNERFRATVLSVTKGQSARHHAAA